MNNQVSFNRRTQLLRVSLILGGVLFCVVALLQMRSTSSLSASLRQAKEQSTNGAEATATLVSLPIKHTITTIFTGVHDIDVADLDGDGTLDIIGASLSDKGFTWWKRNEDGKSSDWTPYTYEGEGDFSGTRSLQAADIDNDGDDDVVGAVDGAIVWWENDGSPVDGEWDKHTVAGDFNNAWDIYVANMDTDNDMDILGVANNGDVILWENSPEDGNPWKAHTIATTNEFKASMPSIYAADMDNNGHLDVLVASFTGGIKWWENNGTLPNNGTPWSSHTAIEDRPFSVTSIYPAEMNQTGNLPDIISAYESRIDYIGWWENSGPDANNWGDPNLVKQFDGGRDVHATDLDQDGDMDILGVGTEGVFWWENEDGEGTDWDKHELDSTFTEAKVVMAADINGDTYPDILAAGGGTIAWWQFVPDAPELFEIDNADGDGNYQVSWSTEQDVSIYRLVEDDNPDFFSPITYTTETQPYPITGKTSGTYHYRVRAENEIGHSPWSTAVTAIVPSVPPSPPPPRMLYLPIMRKDPPPTPTPTPETPSPTPETPSPTPTSETPSPTPSPTCITTEVEPNNNLQQAGISNNIPCKAQWITGSHPLDSQDPHGEDYYEIMIDGQGTQNLYVDLDHIPSGKDYNLQIKDMNNQQVGNCFSGQNSPLNVPEHINCPVNTPGTYYIRVYYGSGGGSTDPYRLKWEASP